MTLAGCLTLSRLSAQLDHYVLKPAGLDKSKGLITACFAKDPTDARWKDDAGYQEWAAFVAKF